MSIKLTLITPLALTACNMDPRADEPMAVGDNREIEQARSAARSCGVIAARLDPLDSEQSMLLVASKSSQNAKACVLRWLRANAPDTELTPAKRAEIGLK